MRVLIFTMYFSKIYGYVLSLVKGEALYNRKHMFLVSLHDDLRPINYGICITKREYEHLCSRTSFPSQKHSREHSYGLDPHPSFNEGSENT